MQKNLLSKKIGVFPVLLIVAMCSVAGVLATVMLYKQVSLSMRIVGVWNMKVLDTDEKTELTSIAFGDLTRGQVKLYPATGYYLLDNTGDYNIYVSFGLTNWPTDVTLKMEIFDESYGVWEVLAVNTVYTKVLKPSSNDDIRWRVTLTVSSAAAFQTYSPILTWNANDNSG